MPKLRATTPRRSHELKLRATDEEHSHARSLAQAAGVSLSELLRILLRNERPRRRKALPIADPALLRVLARVAIELSQLARRANEHLDAMPAASIVVRLIEIERALKQIVRP